MLNSKVFLKHTCTVKIFLFLVFMFWFSCPLYWFLFDPMKTVSKSDVHSHAIHGAPVDSLKTRHIDVCQVVTLVSILTSSNSSRCSRSQLACSCGNRWAGQAASSSNWDSWKYSCQMSSLCHCWNGRVRSKAHCRG